MNDTEMIDELAEATDKPDMRVLMDEFQRAGGAVVWNNYNSDRIRLCVWDSQTTDGRKHSKAIGAQAQPWENASDTRMFFVDGIVNTLISVILTAVKKGQLKCIPTEAGDIETSAKLQKVMKYYLDLLRRDLSREMELVLQWGKTTGAALVSVTWDRQMASNRVTVTMDQVMQLQQMAQQQNPNSPLANIQLIVQDKNLQDIAVQIAQQLIPELDTTAKAKKFIKSLRDEGMAQYNKPYVCVNAPCVTALRIGYDVFFPPETIDLQRARVIFRRDFLTEVELRENIETDDWNEKFVELAAKTAGTCSVWNPPDINTVSQSDFSGIYSTSSDQKNNLIEIVWAYVRQINEDGIPELFLTVFCPSVSTNDERSRYAVHRPLGYKHAQYPFIAYKRENVDRRVTSSRGVPQITGTWENSLKTHEDMLNDRAVLEINPPIRVPMRLGQQYKNAPGKQVAAKEGEIESQSPPTGNPALSFNLMDVVQKRAAHYFGLFHPDLLPQDWQIKMQFLVDNFFSSFEEMVTQMAALVLDPDNVSDEELERVCGVKLGMDRSVENITRKFDWAMSFEAATLDSDYTMKKMEMIAKVVTQFNQGGWADPDKMGMMLAAQIDPTFKDAIIADKATASQKMFKEIQNEVALMSLGDEPIYSVDKDPQAQNKMQMMEQIVAKNPDYQKKFSEEGQPRLVIEKRIKNLQQMVAQQQNEQRGRTGV